MDTECVLLLGNCCEVVNSYVMGKNRFPDYLKGVLRDRLETVNSRQRVIQPLINI